MIACGLDIMRFIAPLPLRFKLRMNIFNSWIVTLQRNERDKKRWKKELLHRSTYEMFWYFLGSTFRILYADKNQQQAKFWKKHKKETKNPIHVQYTSTHNDKAHRIGSWQAANSNEISIYGRWNGTHVFNMTNADYMNTNCDASFGAHSRSLLTAQQNSYLALATNTMHFCCSCFHDIAKLTS